MRIKELDVANLVVNKLSVRRDAYTTIKDSDTSISDLAQSIKTIGLLNPIGVRPLPNGMFEIYAGQRRFLAVKTLGCTKINCVIGSPTMTDHQVRIGSLVENFQRQENSSRDKVHAFRVLLENPCNNDISKLCKLVGTSEHIARNYVKMSGLPSEVLDHLDATTDGQRLTLSAATDIASLPACQQLIASSLLLGKSVADSNLIINSLKRRPEVADLVGIQSIVTEAMVQQALRVVESANLGKRDRFSDHSHPWIAHPEDRNKLYKIDSSHEVWSTLLGMGALTRVDVD